MPSMQCHEIETTKIIINNKSSCEGFVTVCTHKNYFQHDNYTKINIIVLMCDRSLTYSGMLEHVYSGKPSLLIFYLHMPLPQHLTTL